jgi:uncharacterized protein
VQIFDLEKKARQAIFITQNFQEIMSQRIAQELLKILVCPLCKNELVFDEKNNELICFKSKLAYRIKDGIPVMLIDEARKIEE